MDWLTAIPFVMWNTVSSRVTLLEVADESIVYACSPTLSGACSRSFSISYFRMILLLPPPRRVRRLAWRSLFERFPLWAALTFGCPWFLARHSLLSRLERPPVPPEAHI